MAGNYQILALFFVFIISANICRGESEAQIKDQENEEIVGTETKDGRLEIIKKIKKINSDGSYTIGYEADDGSFKIESRDVLGHIKGTYGFVDENGEIKRVSYTSTNSSEITSTTPESPTVVQRIPNRNRTTTKRPPTYFSSSFSSTQSTPSATYANSVVLSLARRRTSVPSTTSKNNKNENINSTTPVKQNTVTYASAAPRVLVQGQPSLVNSNTHVRTKSEGQLVRPEVSSVQPTESQFVSPASLRNLELEKPIRQESDSEIRSNILRRQLPTPNNNQNYELREQSLHSREYDNTDVYTNSMSTAHPKPPLFTTTSRPGPVAISTTPFPLSVSRPVSYPEPYQSRSPQDYGPQQQAYFHETTTSLPFQRQSTQTAFPVVQIPPNKLEDSGPFLAFRHPSQREAILVPLSQVQGKLIPVEKLHVPYDEQRQYQYQDSAQNTRVIEIEQQKALVRRLPSPSQRPVTGTSEDNRYEKSAPQQIQVPYPYHEEQYNVAQEPLQPMNVITLQPTSKYVETDIDNDIDQIQPPVSTRDFQKLLHQLILRQSRLEKVSMLTRQPNLVMYQPVRPRPQYSQQIPYFYQKSNIQGPNSAFTVIQDPRAQHRRPSQRNVDPDNYQQRVTYQPPNTYIEQYDPQAYKPNRRVARLQPSLDSHQQFVENADQNEYLPPNVREMLLLRMLQLAINPALPIDESDIEIVNPPVKRKPVRNVEILGEEEEMGDRSQQAKRENNT